jgi:hypothetical protein
VVGGHGQAVMNADAALIVLFLFIWKISVRLAWCMEREYPFMAGMGISITLIFFIRLRIVDEEVDGGCCGGGKNTGCAWVGDAWRQNIGRPS